MRSRSQGFEVLSETAADVWQLLEAPLSMSEIVAKLSVSFGTSGALVAPQVERFVDDLRARGYVVRIDG